VLAVPIVILKSEFAFAFGYVSCEGFATMIIRIFFGELLSLAELAFLIHFLSQYIIIVVIFFFFAFVLLWLNAVFRHALPLRCYFVVRTRYRQPCLVIHPRAISIGITVHFTTEQLSDALGVVMVVVETALLHEVIIIAV
jgi:hypothetical protein